MKNSDGVAVLLLGDAWKTEFVVAAARRAGQPATTKRADFWHTTESRSADMRHCKDTFIGLSTWKCKWSDLAAPKFQGYFTRLGYWDGCTNPKQELTPTTTTTIDHHSSSTPW
jgi:hypothetical protein